MFMTSRRGISIVLTSLLVFVAVVRCHADEEKVTSSDESYFQYLGQLPQPQAENQYEKNKNEKKKRKPKRTPNIFFIFQDDIGFGDLGCYGHPYARTPNLDKLAAEGSLFQNFHVSGTTCNPSRTGFMTGRHPASFPNYMASFGFQGAPTITDMLKSNGYKTAHIGKWHIGPKSSEKNGTYGIDHVEVMGGTDDDPEGKDSKIYAAAIRHLRHHHEQYNNTTPLYMNIWGHACHMKVNPASEHVKNFSDVNVDQSLFKGKFMRQKFKRRSGRVNQMMRRYLAELHVMDKLIGTFLDTIEELGMKDNSIVVFSVDQGPSSGAMGYSGGLRGEKLMQWEGGTRVPFIIRWPGKIPPDTINCNSAISALDFLPTIARITNTRYDPAQFEGEEVADIWMGSERSRKGPIFHKITTNNPEVTRAMFYGKYKMHYNFKGSSQLYDLNANPDEDVNIWNSNQQVGEAMLERLIEWDNSLPKKYSREEGQAMQPFDPTMITKVVGPPNADCGVSNPPLHEARCYEASDTMRQ